MSTLTQSLSFSVRIFQPSFAIKEVFMACIFRIHIPPRSFPRVTMFQFTRCVFLCSCVSPHRKLGAFMSRVLQSPLGRRADCIWKEGMEDITDCIKECRPAKERKRIFQLCILEFTLSSSSWYVPALTPFHESRGSQLVPTHVGS